MTELDAAFAHSLLQSLTLAICATIPSFLAGWVGGVIAGLWRFPARRVLIFACAMPLLLPSFLIAIGLSMLRIVDGFTGAVWAFASMGAPLVFLVTLANTRLITQNQADAARLAGGECLLLRIALRSSSALAGLAALFTSVLSLSDAGPGQIFGSHTAASEILITHAARYDHALAARQGYTLALVAGVVAFPLAFKLSPILVTTLFSQDTSRARLTSRPSATVVLLTLAAFTVGLPFAGLTQPILRRGLIIERAWREATRTASDTILYALVAAAAAVIVGFATAHVLPRRVMIQRIAVALALVAFSLPSVIPALWLSDYQSRITLGLALGLRFLPIALLFALRSQGGIPPSWAEAAQVHRVRRAAFFVRVVVPWHTPWILATAALVALLATAEVGMVLLLHPPGHATFPLAIFAVMANAPEPLVATLCLLYASLAGTVAIAFLALRRHR